MAQEKLGFDDFIATVPPTQVDFVSALHRDLTERGCKMEVKSAKSGYVVSYLYAKKTVMNYVFRKSGLLARIYTNHIGQYMAVLETLPDGMADSVEASSPCKRLLDPDACNPKCAMGYDFILRGKRQQKCRNGAFFFPINDETAPFVKALLLHELDAAS